MTMSASKAIEWIGRHYIALHITEVGKVNELLEIKALLESQQRQLADKDAAERQLKQDVVDMRDKVILERERRESAESRLSALTGALSDKFTEAAEAYAKGMSVDREKWAVVEAAAEVYEWLKRNKMEYTAHGRLLGDALRRLEASREGDV